MKVLTDNITIKDMLNACKGEYKGNVDLEVTGFVTDSREVFEGCVFIAIKGEKADGAQFIPSVIEKGACCAISATLPEGYEDRVILVKDAVEAVGMIASAHRSRMKDLRIAAVTGSVGKTTTKEMIYSVLSQKFTTHKTTANHNSNIGLPTSMLALNDGYDSAIYEMGMSAKGEISYMTNIVKPDVAVITNIGNMHIEYLGSREGIRDAKMEIAEGLSLDGTLILNGDEPLLAGVKGAIYVSFDNPEGDVKIQRYVESTNGCTFDLLINGKAVSDLYIPVMGKHNILNAAMAYAVGVCFSMTDSEIRQGLACFESGDMRQNFEEYKDVTILMDCYNAGPESTAASLQVLSSYCESKGKRRVGVLGEMRELGSYSDKLHFETGVKASCCVDLLFTVGKSRLADGARQGGMADCNIYELANMDYGEAAKIIASVIKPGDCLLFKASRSVKLENLIDELKKVY